MGAAAGGRAGRPGGALDWFVCACRLRLGCLKRRHFASVPPRPAPLQGAKHAHLAHRPGAWVRGRPTGRAGARRLLHLLQLLGAGRQRDGRGGAPARAAPRRTRLCQRPQVREALAGAGGRGWALVALPGAVAGLAGAAAPRTRPPSPHARPHCSRLPRVPQPGRRAGHAVRDRPEAQLWCGRPAAAALHLWLATRRQRRVCRVV